MLNVACLNRGGSLEVCFSSMDMLDHNYSFVMHLCVWSSMTREYIIILYHSLIMKDDVHMHK